MEKELFLIIGFSGSGKSTCLKHFEDLEIDVIRGLPVEFLDDFLGKFYSSESKNMALEIFNKPLILHKKLVLELIDKYRKIGILIRIIFLEADKSTLILRYKESRRKHPMDINSIENGIEIERRELAEFKELSEVSIDTTRMTPYELKLMVNKIVIYNNQKIKIVIISFPYKNGVPLEADCVFDVRFLKNPYYEQNLKNLGGNTYDIQNYFKNDPVANQFIDLTEQYLETVIKLLEREGRDVFYIAFGCTGGLHRSVYIAEQIFNRLKSKKINVEIFHKNPIVNKNQ